MGQLKNLAQCSPLGLDIALWLGLHLGVSSDGSVGLLVHLLNAVCGDAVLDVEAKLPLVGILIIVLEQLHVIGDVLAKDVVAVNLSIELLGLAVIAREAFLAMRDVQTTIHGTLQAAEDLGSGAGTGQTHVEVAAEGTRLAVLGLYVVHLAIHLLLAGIDGVQLELLQDPASQQEPGAVGSRVIGQPDLDAVSGQLVGISSSHDVVTLDSGVRYLTRRIYQ